MIIKKLVLHNYKRFFLSGIKTLEYTPVSNIQFIISKNGAGKSSLMSQLNPLPSESKKDFYENGYKYIEIEHNGSIYKLNSGVETKSYSFIKDGKELNTSNGKRVQLELVKEHFNITPAIMDILLCLNRFTFMSPSERKNWITEMSTIDYTFPINVYNKLKSKHRDITGTIRTITSELTKHTNLILNKDEIEKLIKDKEMLDNFNTHIVSLYTYVNDENRSAQDLTSLNTTFSNLLETVNENIDVKKLEEELNKSKLLLSDTDNKIKHIVKLIEKTEELKNIGDKKFIIDRLNTIEPVILNIKNTIELEEDISLYEHIFKEYKQTHTDLLAILNNMLEYEDIRLYNGNVEDSPKLWRKTLEIIRVDYDFKYRRKLVLEKDLIHIQEKHTENNKTICPSCGFKWYEDQNKEEEINKELEVLKPELEKSSLELEKYTNKVKRLEEIEKLIEDFKYLILSKPQLKSLWKLILSDFNINTDTVINIISVLDSYLLKLSIVDGLENLLKEQKELRNNLSVLEEIEKLNTELQINKLKEYEKELEQLTSIKHETNNNINILNNRLYNYNKLVEIRNNVFNSLKIKGKELKKEVTILRNNYLMELSKYLKTEIMEIDNKLNISSNALHLLESEKSRLNEYTEKERVLGLVLKELSPTEGLIAKSINSFLLVFTEELNQVINSIWSYEVEVLPSVVNDNDELDYKFKVKINNDEVIEDISKLSSSLKEIVDLAFRIVFMKYMGLSNYPLYLDEFGNTFDKEHRTSAYGVIEKILTSEFNQLFIICHYESLYGSFKNANFNVINRDNVELDNSLIINECFKLTYK